MGRKRTLESNRLGPDYSVQNAFDEWSLPFQIFANAAGVFRLKAQLQVCISLTICWALLEMVSNRNISIAVGCPSMQI